MRTASAIDINTNSQPLYVKNITTTYSHWLVPALAGYNIQLSKRWHVIPGGGLLLSFNSGETNEWELTSGQMNKSRSGYLNSNLRQPTIFSAFATAGLGIQFDINSKLSIHAAPAFNYMVTKMRSSSVSPEFHPYNILVNTGVVLDI